MTARLVALCFDAEDPDKLARFWAQALGWDLDDERTDVVALRPTDGTSFGVVFRPASEPRRGRNRIHLDLTSTSLEDQQDSVVRLLAFGGSHLDVGQGEEDQHVVLADPEGNALCLIEPGNGFLADCDRLGALSCDGSRSVGLFWSAVLGWPLVWDQGEETAIRAPDLTGPMITWGGGPDYEKVGKSRLYLDIAVDEEGEIADELQRLEGLGARRIELADAPTGCIPMADPDDNEFYVSPSFS